LAEPPATANLSADGGSSFADFRRWRFPMADPQPNVQRLQQFMQLLPLTMEIAGLPRGDAGRYYNDDQMDLRAQAIRKAYKHARSLVKEIANEQAPAAG
jgi:hypothetical protein